MRRKPKRSTSSVPRPKRLTAGERAIVTRAATLAADHYRVFRPLVFAATRSRKAATDARQLAMYLANCAGGMPIERVALAFGRDASTVSHNIGLIEDRRDNAAFDQMIEELEKTFSNPSPTPSNGALGITTPRACTPANQR